MDFLEFVTTRQSVRAFDTERPVEKEKIERIVEAARLAPSACNAQPWHLIVVDEPELKNKVADATSARALGMNHFTKTGTGTYRLGGGEGEPYLRGRGGG